MQRESTTLYYVQQRTMTEPYECTQTNRGCSLNLHTYNKLRPMRPREVRQLCSAGAPRVPWPMTRRGMAPLRRWRSRLARLAPEQGATYLRTWNFGKASGLHATEKRAVTQTMRRYSRNLGFTPVSCTQLSSYRFNEKGTFSPLRFARPFIKLMKFLKY